MWKTVLRKTLVTEKRVSFEYDYPDEWNVFMPHVQERLFSEYDFSIEQIPVSILNIQFVANAMLLNMFHNGIIEVEELDRDFYNAIPGILSGYRKLYPDRDINITVKSNKLIDNSFEASGKKVIAFTGGVDATSAVASHLNEDLTLVNIWGGDIKLDNPIRHSAHEDYFRQFSKTYGFAYSGIKSNFRFIYDDSFIPDKFEHDWWCAIGHSVLIPAVMAPITYKLQASTLYLASSYTWREYDEHMPHDCNYIGIVNEIKMSGCRVEQCDSDMSRSDKIKNIALTLQPVKEGQVSLLACWNHEKDSIVNCCRCEKCYRTIMDIKSCKQDPVKFGFRIDSDLYERIERFVKGSSSLPDGMWRDIQKQFIVNKEYWKNEPDVNWIFKVKINNPYVNLYPWRKRAYWKCREIAGKLKRKLLKQK